MNSKVIARAIVALFAIVATTAIALSLTFNNQAQQPAKCSVPGYMVSTFG